MPNPFLPRWDDPRVRWDDGWTWPTEAELAAALSPAAPATQPRKRRPMPTDYIPQSYKNQRDWLTLQQTDLTLALSATVGMTGAEHAGFPAAVGALLPRVAEIVDLMEQLEQKTADLGPVQEQQLAVLRAAIKRAKTHPGCTPGLLEQLQWVGESSEFDPDTARPTISLEAQRGRIKIDGRKPGFEAVNVYCRKKGEVAWRLIAVRKRRFPYYDEAPLAVPGTPEVREYMAIGVLADDETGQPSEIKEVVYAG
jgi:hypothetical protein